MIRSNASQRGFLTSTLLAGPILALQSLGEPALEVARGQARNIEGQSGEIIEVQSPSERLVDIDPASPRIEYNLNRHTNNRIKL
jgi:hypothetical protein